MGKVVSRNCVRIGVLDSAIEHNYTGVVADSFELRVEDSFRFVLSGFLVI